MGASVQSSFQSNRHTAAFPEPVLTQECGLALLLVVEVWVLARIWLGKLRLCGQCRAMDLVRRDDSSMVIVDPG